MRRGRKSGAGESLGRSGRGYIVYYKGFLRFELGRQIQESFLYGGNSSPKCAGRGLSGSVDDESTKYKWGGDYIEDTHGKTHRHSYIDTCIYIACKSQVG